MENEDRHRRDNGLQNRETLKGDEYVHYLNSDNGFTYIYVCVCLNSNCILQTYLLNLIETPKILKPQWYTYIYLSEHLKQESANSGLSAACSM